MNSPCADSYNATCLFSILNHVRGRLELSGVFYTSTKYASFDEGLLLSLRALTDNWLPLSNVDDRSYSVLQPMASNEDGAKKIRMVR